MARAVHVACVLAVGLGLASAVTHCGSDAPSGMPVGIVPDASESTPEGGDGGNVDGGPDSDAAIPPGRNFSLAMGGPGANTESVAVVGGVGTVTVGGNVTPSFDRSWIVHLDTMGAVRWKKTYATTRLFALAAHPAGGFLAGGTIQPDVGTPGAWLARLAADGGIVWQKQISSNGAEIRHIAPLPDGSLYFTGSFGNAVSVGKVDAAGGLSWTHTLFGGVRDEGRRVVLLPSGAVVVGGSTIRGGGVDFVLASYSASGTLLWQKAYGTPEYNSLNDLAVATDGAVYATGMDGAIGSSNLVLLKIETAAGNVLWQKALKGSDRELGAGVVVTPAGGVVVAGEGTLANDAGGPFGHLLLGELSPQGDLRWVRSSRSEGGDRATSLASGPGGELLVGGQIQHWLPTSFDAWLLRLGPDGVFGGCSTSRIRVSEDAITGYAVVDPGFVTATPTMTDTDRTSSTANVDGTAAAAVEAYPVEDTCP